MTGSLVFGTEIGWAALSVAGAGLLLVSYLGWRRSWAGAVLRGLAFLCVAVLAFRPELISARKRSVRKKLAVMLDVSRSMAAPDADGGTRFDRVRAVFDVAPETFDAERFSFDGEVRRAEGPEPTGRATSLSGALDAAARAGADVVLMATDGGHNSGADPVEAARRLGGAVHVLFSGPWPPAPNLRVPDIRAPEEIEEGQNFRVTAQTADTSRPVTCVVRLFTGGEERGRKTVRAGARFSFLTSLRGEGTHVVTVEAVPFEGEAIVRDNARSLVVFATESPLKVAYVEGLFRPDYGAVSSALRESGLPFQVVRAFAGEERLPPADVYLVGRADADLGIIELFLAACRRDAGLIALPGGRWLNEFLAGECSGESHEEAALVLTPAGRKALGRVELPRARGILRARLREGAEVLVQTERGEPVVAAVRPEKGGRAVQIFSKSLFRWDRPALGRLLAALSRWSAGKGPGKEMSLRLSRYRVDEGGSVGVRVEAPEGRKVSCRLRVRGEETPVELVERGEALLGVLAVEEPGIHELIATDGRDEARVHMQVLGVEGEDLFPPDRPLVKRMARATGGRVWEPEETEELKRELRKLGGEREVEIKTARALWDSPLLLAAFVLLMTAEWFLASRGARG